MKYIKTYEDLDEIKYTLDDMTKFKYWCYKGSRDLIFRINKIKFGVNFYHPNENDYNVTVFYIDENYVADLPRVENDSLKALFHDKYEKKTAQILRPATEEEIEDFYLKINTDKYNL